MVAAAAACSIFFSPQSLRNRVDRKKRHVLDRFQFMHFYPKIFFSAV